MGIRDGDRIKDMLPGRAGHVGVTARNNRLFVDAVLDTGQEFPGVTFRKNTATSATLIGGSAGGRKKASGPSCCLC